MLMIQCPVMQARFPCRREEAFEDCERAIPRLLPGCMHRIFPEMILGINGKE